MNSVTTVSLVIVVTSTASLLEAAEEVVFKYWAKATDEKADKMVKNFIVSE